MPQLNPEFFSSQIFWLFIVFCLIYLFVAKFFLPRISGVVTMRAKSIEDDVAFAESKVEECRGIEVSATAALANARAKAFAIVDTATKAAEKSLADKMDSMEKEIMKKSAREEEKLSRMQSQLKPQIEDIANGLKDEIVSHIMQSLKSKKAKNN